MRRLAALALPMLAACGVLQAPPEMLPRGEPGLQEVLRLRYRRSFISPLSQAFRPTEVTTPEPDPWRERLYVGTTDNHLYSVRASDGATVWRFKTHAPIEAEPFYARDADVVYFASGDGSFYAVSAESGRELWHHEIRVLSLRRPLVTDDAVYVSGGGTSVFAIDRRNGERLWVYRREAPGGFAVEGQAGVASIERHLYTGFSDGVVVALSSVDGTVEWERDTSLDVEELEGASPAPVDVDTTPIVVGQLVHVASHAAGVYGLAADGGGVEWRREDLTGVTGLAAHDGVLYATKTGRGLVALEPATGRTLWQARIPGGGFSTPVLHGGYAYVTSHRKGLYLVRLSDGLVVQGIEPGRGIFGAPAVLGRRAFFLSNSAVLYALDRS